MRGGVVQRRHEANSGDNGGPSGVFHRAVQLRWYGRLCGCAPWDVPHHDRLLLCAAPVLTPAPTPSPTPDPTPSPTANPTPLPTADPTPGPTPRCGDGTDGGGSRAKLAQAAGWDGARMRCCLCEGRRVVESQAMRSEVCACTARRHRRLLLPRRPRLRTQRHRPQRTRRLCPPPTRRRGPHRGAVMARTGVGSRAKLAQAARGDGARMRCCLCEGCRGVERRPYQGISYPLTIVMLYATSWFEMLCGKGRANECCLRVISLVVAARRSRARRRRARRVRARWFRARRARARPHQGISYPLTIVMLYATPSFEMLCGKGRANEWCLRVMSVADAARRSRAR
jgi:hypothetical protein